MENIDTQTKFQPWMQNVKKAIMEQPQLANNIDDIRINYAIDDHYPATMASHTTPLENEVIRLAFEQNHSIQDSLSLDFTIDNQSFQIVVAMDTHSNAYYGTLYGNQINNAEVNQCWLDNDDPTNMRAKLLVKDIMQTY